MPYNVAECGRMWRHTMQWHAYNAMVYDAMVANAMRWCGGSQQGFNLDQNFCATNPDFDPDQNPSL